MLPDNPLRGTDDFWMGFDDKGEPISLTHSKMMEWAMRNDAQFQVGWSEHVRINGSRLVRGKKMIATARKKDWNDIADRLVDAGFVDE